jgi:hypothetical protein
MKEVTLICDACGKAQTNKPYGDWGTVTLHDLGCFNAKEFFNEVCPDCLDTVRTIFIALSNYKTPDGRTHIPGVCKCAKCEARP